MNKEQLIFEMVKDNSFDSASSLKKYVLEHYGYELKNSNLYIKIIGYQIDKYGCQLINVYYVEKGDGLKKSKNSKDRRHNNHQKRIVYYEN